MNLADLQLEIAEWLINRGNSRYVRQRADYKTDQVAYDFYEVFDCGCGGTHHDSCGNPRYVKTLKCNMLETLPAVILESSK